MYQFAQFRKRFLNKQNLKLNKFDQKLIVVAHISQDLNTISLLIHKKGLQSYPRLAVARPIALAEARGG